MSNEYIGFDLSEGFCELDLDGVPETVEQPAELLAPDEALMKCLDERGAVDMERITALCGLSVRETLNALRGTVVRDPNGWDGEFAHGFVLRDQYLSGNLMERLARAKEANHLYHGLFEENINMLSELIPSIGARRRVAATLGAPWIPPQVIDDFIREGLGIRLCPEDRTLYDPVNSLWRMDYTSKYKRDIQNCSVFGTYEMPALRILEKTLNATTPEVYKNTFCEEGKRDIDHAKTALAKENQRRIIEAFEAWVFADDDRRRMLSDRYDSVFGRVSNRRFDGSFISTPGMNENISLFDHQLSAVAHVVFNPNTLIVHEVGTGKTYTMIVAGQTLRRMGLSAKNMFVVPNAIIGQWQEAYTELFPEANVLVVDRRNFGPARRQKTLRLIKEGDFDAIIIAASSFGMIPLSRQERIEDLKRRKARLMNDMCGENVKRKLVEREIEKINKEMAEIEEEAEFDRILGRDEGVCFDHLGVTTLFVDEAHEYKNITVKTRGKAVFGITKRGSAKCDGMLAKVQFTQRIGRGAVFATATPICNSITDVYVMQTYLQQAELRYLGLGSFDSWAATFAQRIESTELDIDGMSIKTVTRLANFRNLTELTALFGQIADFHLDKQEEDVRQHNTVDVQVPCAKELRDYFNCLSDRADVVRAGGVDRSDDNLLRITIDGRIAALDLRAIADRTCNAYATKTFSCALKVFRIWEKTAEDRCAQLVFCDLSTPKKGFNVYDELKRCLTMMGVPENEVCFIHDAASETEKIRLFEAVNEGTVRVLVGSTRKLGTGVNVQRRLCAIHHLDIPWTPSYITQREGRMLRAGNLCEDLTVYRYVTADTFDAFSWQLLQFKQTFIAQFLSNNLDPEADCDFDRQALSFAQIKALAVGNPDVREYVEVQNELNRLNALQRAYMSQRRRMHDELRDLPETIARQRAHAEGYEADAATVASEEQPDKEERRMLGEALTEDLAENVMHTEERFYDQYRGLDIMLPANMLAEEPLVILRGRERTIVPMGTDPKGNYRRLQIAAEGMGERAKKAWDVLDTLTARQAVLEKELAVEDPYAVRLAAVRDKFERLDQKIRLGSLEDTGSDC